MLGIVKDSALRRSAWVLPLLAAALLLVPGCSGDGVDSDLSNYEQLEGRWRARERGMSMTIAFFPKENRALNLDGRTQEGDPADLKLLGQEGDKVTLQVRPDRESPLTFDITILDSSHFFLKIAELDIELLFERVLPDNT